MRPSDRLPPFSVWSFVAVVALLLLGGCASGANSSPNVLGSIAPSQPTGPLVSATMQIAFSARSELTSKRRAKYVSPNAESFAVVVDGAAPIVVTVSSCALNASTYMCSVPITAAAGPITATVTLYDAPNGAGTILGIGTCSTTLVLNSTNTISIAIAAVVGSVSVGAIAYTPGTGFVYGTTATALVPVTFADPDANVLPVGAQLVSPVTTTSSDATAILSTSSFSAVPSGLTLAYNGSTSIASSTTLTFAYASATIGTSTVAISPLVTTYAGNGIAGFVDGPAASAEFDNTYAVATDSSNNVYVANDNSDVIQKISPAGIVTTFAGTGSAGFINGSATSAEFNHPVGIAVDSSGNVYVADQYNMAIRKIAGGMVTTLAGSGAAGYADGPGATARFYYPQSVAVDSAGNVYVCDEYNKRIREVSPSGVVSTLAGNGTQGDVDGPVASAEFNGLAALIVDTSGNVYVSDNDSVRKISPSGIVSTIAGNGTAGYVDGTGSAAQFNSPYGLAFDSIGNLYIDDAGNERVRKMTPAGVVTTFAGKRYERYTQWPGAGSRIPNSHRARIGYRW